jgi:hypothetical protein
MHHGTKMRKSKKKLTKVMNVCIQALSFNKGGGGDSFSKPSFYYYYHHHYHESI